MHKTLFGFIGCGNMGAALARAARKNLGASQILLTNRTAEKALSLSRELGCRVVVIPTDGGGCCKACLGTHKRLTRTRRKPE